MRGIGLTAQLKLDTLKGAIKNVISGVQFGEFCHNQLNSYRVKNFIPPEKAKNTSNNLVRKILIDAMLKELKDQLLVSMLE